MTAGSAPAQEDGFAPDRHADRRERGMALIEHIGGSAEAICAPQEGIAPDLARYVAEFAFGDLYSRPGLDHRQRQLVTIGMLIALGDTEPQLRFHIGAALNVGVEPQTVVETLLHALAFAGFPRVVNGMRVAKAVFAERGLLPIDTAAANSGTTNGSSGA